MVITLYYDSLIRKISVLYRTPTVARTFLLIHISVKQYFKLRKFGRFKFICIVASNENNLMSEQKKSQIFLLWLLSLALIRLRNL
jgi:hypothetical protein